MGKGQLTNWLRNAENKGAREACNIWEGPTLWSSSRVTRLYQYASDWGVSQDEELLVQTPGTFQENWGKLVTLSSKELAGTLGASYLTSKLTILLISFASISLQHSNWGGVYVLSSMLPSGGFSSCLSVKEGNPCFMQTVTYYPQKQNWQEMFFRSLDVKEFRTRYPKYATLVYWLFWVKGTQERADARKAIWPSFFFLEVGDKISMWKVPSQYQEEETLLSLEKGVKAKRNLLKQTLLK